MDKYILNQLKEITEEEKKILGGDYNVCKSIYTSKKEFVVDSKKLLEKGRLIELRSHTRFVHFPKHCHNYVEMVYMCSGSTTHVVDDQDEIVLNKGDILLLNQNSTHEILPSGINDIAVNFIILPEFFDRPLSMIEKENTLRDFMISVLSKKNGESSYLHFQAEDILPVQNLMENMIWSLLCKKQGMNTINQTTMGLLFMNLSMFVDTANKNNPNKIEQNIVFSVLKYIDNYYKDGSLSFISDKLSVQEYYVSKLLKKHTGYNFKELLQQRKLQQAAYLLKETPITIDSVMEAIGYENSSYFYRQFKKKYGCTPTEYRK